MPGKPDRVRAGATREVKNTGPLRQACGYKFIHALTHAHQVGIVFDELVVFIRVAVVGFGDDLEGGVEVSFVHGTPLMSGLDTGRKHPPYSTTEFLIFFSRISLLSIPSR